MKWHSLSPALELPRTAEAEGTLVRSTTEGQGYLGFNREFAQFSSPPTESSFFAVPESTMHVSVPTAMREGAIILQLCVICYFDDEINSQKFWSDPGNTALEFDVPVGVRSVSLVMRLEGRGIVLVGAPDIQEGVSLAKWVEKVSVTPGQRLQLNITTRSTMPLENSALVQLQFLDAHGYRLAPSPESPINPLLGNYFYLNTSEGNRACVTTVELDAVPEATALELTGRQWKAQNKTTVMEDTRLVQWINETRENKFQEVLSHVASLPENLPLIVLYTTAPPVGHATLSLRPNRLAEEYRKLGVEVIFFPFSRITDEQRVTDSGIVQFNRTELDQVNEVLCARQGRSNVFICSSYPDIGALTTIDLLGASRWGVVYEVRDEMEEFNRVGYSKWYEPELERQVVERADHIVTVSPRLARKMQVISGGTAEPIVVQNAAPPGLIAKGEELRTPEVISRRLEHRVVGYIGHLTDSWFDWDLLIACALENPDLNFEIIGHGMPSILNLPENINYLGPRTHDEFLEISRRWLVGLIPFQATSLTYAVDPNKIYEYLALGLRTVTAPMGAVAFCPSTYVYDRPEDFSSTLRRAVTDEFASAELDAINKYIRDAGWESRAQIMLDIAGLERVSK